MRFCVIRLRDTPLRLPGRHAKRPVLALLASVALLSLTLAVPTPIEAAGTTHYISPRGSDSNSGTASHPWRTIYASLRRLHPGDTLYIRGGTYYFSGVHSTGLAGTATRPILISNYPGETPTFVGTSAPADFLYFSGNAAWITLRGLTISGGGAVRDSSGSSLLGFTGNANHIRVIGVRLIGRSNWAGNQHLVYVAANSVNDITITKSILDGRGCQCQGLLQFFHDPSAARVTVSYNTFRNGDQGILVWASVAGLRIVSNTFSHVRIAVRHHHSLGTSVVSNRGSYVSIGVYADSRLHLTQSANRW